VLIGPISTGFMGGPDAVHYPPNSHTYDEVHDAGGIVIAAHDVTKEVPIQAILGKLDVLDAHNTNRYYDLLNCGVRIPLSIGSDYPANLMGFARVYVYCGKELLCLRTSPVPTRIPAGAPIDPVRPQVTEL
jgi:hypothetical protein